MKGLEYISVSLQEKFLKENYPMGSITPTLDKMLEIQEDSQLCGEFLDFLLSKFSMFDKKQTRETPYMNIMGAGDYINKEKLLAEFFDINLEDLEKERQMILESLYGERQWQ